MSAASGVSPNADPPASRKLRAPKADRSVLIEPALDGVGAMLQANGHRRQGYRYDFGGVDLGELSRQARRELIAEAMRWTTSYRDVTVSQDSQQRIFLAGHQPQLFHPGVWLKNFALAMLAKRHGATAINLIVDSDTVKSTSLRVPGGSAARPNVALVPLDEPGPVIPFEERTIVDRGAFEQFGHRAVRQIGSLVREPMLATYWPLAVARSRATGVLGDCLAQSRHQLEGQWGLNTLEAPQSRVCRTPSFARFSAHLFEQLPRLFEVYNASVREYRRVHRIRSTAHPVPELAIDGPWREAPYWIWSSDDPRRRRLFVRRDAKQLLLSDRKALVVELPCGADGDVAAATERLVEVSCGNVRIRSRALVTTLYARLVLGDLFLHGIGGAKYDQLTDALMARFFGVAPPGYMVLSATLLLPGAAGGPGPGCDDPGCGDPGCGDPGCGDPGCGDPGCGDPGVSGDALREVDRRLRELAFHPETFLDTAELANSQESAALVEAKRQWIATPQSPHNAHVRWQQFRRINAQLQRWVGGQRDRLLERRAELAAAIKTQSVLGWREYGFCLYPETMLREFFAETVG